MSTSIIRSILGVFVGLLVAFTLVGVIESIGHAIYPPPPGLNVKDPEHLKTIIDKLPVGAIVAVLIAWACGTLGGSFTAAAIAGRAPLLHAYLVGGLLMAAGLGTMIWIPHPVWFMVAAVAIFLGFAGLGGWLASTCCRRRPKPGDPRPYDMRKKNMAC